VSFTCIPTFINHGPTKSVSNAKTLDLHRGYGGICDPHLDCAYWNGRATFVVIVINCWCRWNLPFTMAVAWFLVEDFLKVDLIRTAKQNEIM
jgi:hypothetical protein